jgi:hypothetical protein
LVNPVTVAVSAVEARSSNVIQPDWPVEYCTA